MLCRAVKSWGGGQGGGAAPAVLPAGKPEEASAYILHILSALPAQKPRASRTGVTPSRMPVGSSSVSFPFALPNRLGAEVETSLQDGAVR